MCSCIQTLGQGEPLPEGIATWKVQ
jgi:hypothetical protein